MGYSVTIWEEDYVGNKKHSTKLVLFSRKIKVRELIEQKVKAEVDKYNASIDEKSLSKLYFTHENEKILNSSQKSKKNYLVYDLQCEKALKSFQENGFFIIVDDKQVTDLEEDIILMDNSQISFLRLVPLIGG